MSKSAPKDEKRENDEDYEVVSFEDFCDKSPGSKTDFLTLNDNINYRLCYESDKGGKFSDNGESSQQMDGDRETSLNDNSVTWRKKATSFAPFGKYDPKLRRGSLLAGVIPKTDGEASREHRYQRFSNQKTYYERICENLPGLGSTMLILVVIAALSIGVWWAVCGALGGTWGEEHYRRLWERAHPDESRHAPHAPPVQPVAPLEKILPEYRYHDHNNLSTKNKNNATEKKKELFKKSFNMTAPLESDCKLIRNNYRFDCHPQEGATEELCRQRGCCWNNKTAGPDEDEPACYFPAGYSNYRRLNLTENTRGMSAFYERIRPSGYPDDFETVAMDIKYFDDHIVQIKIYDAVNKRFEPPYPQIPATGSGISNKTYRVVVDNNGLGFKVLRKNNNDTLIDTRGSGIILSDKFLQFSSVLPFRSLVFGLGEHRDKFKLNQQWKTYTLFNRDAVPVENMNLYGSHPFMLAMEPLADSFGIFLHNSNAMDVVLQPAPAVTFRTTGGILDFRILLGPRPLEVASQYAGLVGLPALPPYWALGFHLSKFNYGSLNATEQVWQKNRDLGIPLDSQWNDLDYMQSGNDFTYDKKKFAGLPQFVEKLHKNNYHYVVLIDPGISGSEKRGGYAPYDRAVEMDVLIKNSSSQPFVGKVWNRLSTVYPDFTHPNATAYWLEMMQSFHKQVPFDGAWIDMNEPSNFLSGSMYGQCEPEELPYKPKTIGPEGLKTKTLCMEARHYAGPHRHFHNLHAFTEAVATHFALAEIRGKRPFIISRATCPGMGQFAGHWSGDVRSDWHDMQMTIPELLNFNLFGIPMMGADICGFRGNTTVELCRRWTQLGAFYPFSRNHNSDTSNPQDPASLGISVVMAARKALRLRYSLLPYYYTHFYRAHQYGEMLVRPVYFQYDLEQNAYGNDEQFMIGPHVLIAPILRPEGRQVHCYLPGDAPWVSLYTDKLVPPGEALLDESSTVVMAPGAIIVTHSLPPLGEVITTHSLRGRPLQLRATASGDLRAQGELYWDDGEGCNSYEEKKYSLIKFDMKNGTLTSEVVWWGYGIPHVTEMFIWNLGDGVKYVHIGDMICNTNAKLCKFVFEYDKKMLHVYNLELDLQKPLNITFGAYKRKVETVKITNGTNVECKGNDCKVTVNLN